jgi:dTDP-4-dehydrorhamnose reductase
MTKILVLGATGLLGQAVGAEASSRGFNVLRAARHGVPLALDIEDPSALKEALGGYAPDVVVNCAAITDIDLCENDPGMAYRINARPLSVLSDWSKASGGKLVHVSTDHYFATGGALPHDESAPVTFVNEYARSKFAGESFAMADANSLVLRTNIVGIRGWERLTFAEWAIDVVINDKPATFFTDVYGSSIDVRAFSVAMFDLVAANARGLLNLAAGEIFSKDAFMRELARQLARHLAAALSGPSSELAVKRANCLGLDVRRAEAILGRKLPSLQQVVASVVRQYREIYP